MDKRAFLAIALSILILVIYQEWMTRYYGTPAPAPEAETKEPEKAPAAEQLKPAPASVPQTKPVPAPPSKEVKEINIETDNYIAVFTNQGARLKSLKFKKYRSAVKDNSPPFDIVSRLRVYRCRWASDGRVPSPSMMKDCSTQCRETT